MDTLILEDFRCFAGRHEVPIRPLTLLVGENSTGKTSFLAAVRAAHDLRAGAAPDFNEEPFHLGSYDQIANYRGGSSRRAKSFTIGQVFTAPSGISPRMRRPLSERPRQIEAVSTSDKTQPAISEFSISSGEHEIRLKSEDEGRTVMSFAADNQIVTALVSMGDLWASRSRFRDDFWFNIRRALHRLRDRSEGGLTEEEAEHFENLTGSLRYRMDHYLYAFAPIRTSPRRTYDPTKEIRDPEGSHTPMMLARLLNDRSASDFRKRLDEFGEASGLFSSLGIRKLGRTDSDPFQIQVKLPSGPRRNLIDVGYGVSQAIPIIADCVSAEVGSTLLIQQPEVHLHPRAQAAMGSFFGQLAASERNRLVVETHSDFLVDRVLMDVRDEKIKPGDVIILYFEHGLHGVEIHPIEVDASGRIVEAPDSYRSFFLDEQRRFFGID